MMRGKDVGKDVATITVVGAITGDNIISAIRLGYAAHWGIRQTLMQKEQSFLG